MARDSQLDTSSGEIFNCSSKYIEIQKYWILFSEGLSMSMNFLTENKVTVVIPASYES